MRTSRHLFNSFIAGTIAWAVPISDSYAVPPDHVVIVIEENHEFVQVIGYAGAPYINGLATSQYGASLTNMYAISHPSLPNYLQLYCGTNQGVTSDSIPGGTPFSTGNLGAALLAVGQTFTGFSQGLPSVGSLVTTSGAYARKHNPWSMWQANSPGTNQLLPTTNQPFMAFPGDFSTLPTVSIVVPDLNNDMHDGTVDQGDSWLQTNIGPYADWTLTHNSLLIVTWDEDETASGRNRIPTIFYGPMVRSGNLTSTWTLHGLLRTVVDMYGAAAPGISNLTRPIVGALASDPSNIQVISFQQGAAGYASAADTYIESANPSTSHATTTPLVADISPATQMLIRFDSILGLTIDKVPPGSQILSAKLVFLTGSNSTDAGTDPIKINRMLIPWSDSDSWNSLTAGVSTNGTDATTASDFAITPNTLNTYGIFDVTASVQAWVSGASTNYGWVISGTTGADEWRVSSSEAAAVGDRPRLEVVLVRAPCAADFNHSGVVSIQDVFDFLTAFFAGLPSADFNHLGGVTVQDLFDFLAAWFAPCV